MIVVDTDVVIDLLRQHDPALTWLASLDDEVIVLPGYVSMELIQGCKNKRQLRTLQRFIAEFEVVWPSSVACNIALDVYATHYLSHNVGLLDVLIAHTAIELNQPLHTFNQKHYTPLVDLNTVQPYHK